MNEMWAWNADGIATDRGETWALRTYRGTTLSTTITAWSGLGLNPAHSRERPATNRLSIGTTSRQSVGNQVSMDLAFLYYTSWFLDFVCHSYSEQDVPFRKMELLRQSQLSIELALQRT
jgi:hypothetical protein